jgi:hypothetical protein
MVNALPGLLEGASDEQIDRFVDYLEPARFETAGRAMRKAAPDLQGRFARIAHSVLGRRFSSWRSSSGRSWRRRSASIPISID